jgi:hypothetical protein
MQAGLQGPNGFSARGLRLGSNTGVDAIDEMGGK